MTTFLNITMSYIFHGQKKNVMKQSESHSVSAHLKKNVMIVRIFVRR